MMRIVAVFIMLTTMPFFAVNAYAGPLDYLDGRWAGWGRLHTTNGMSERLKCVTTYKTSNGGTRAVQNFRCTSKNYRFSSVLNYAQSGGHISGNWKEQIYSAGGGLQGHSQPGTIQALLRAVTFTANVSIKSSQCKQNIVIRLKGSVEIDRFDVQLRRC